MHHGIIIQSNPLITKTPIAYFVILQTIMLDHLFKQHLSMMSQLDNRFPTLPAIKALGYAIIRADCLLNLKPDAITLHSPTQ